MIGPFREKYRFLSSFWLVPVSYEGDEYPSVEHAYQAAKTQDGSQRLGIRSQLTPGAAKRLGRKLKTRPDWEAIKLHVMHMLVLQKFQFTDLREKLLATDNEELVEINEWGDKFWGMIRENGELVGENHLGKILMQVRDAVR